MSPLHYKAQDLFLEDVSLTNIAVQFGTPCYVYSQATILSNWHAYYDALKKANRAFKIHYAVKANSNLNILRLLAKHNAGFDVVSGGEIERVLRAGGNAKDIVFAGVGKTLDEINRAIDLGIGAFHVESGAELERINDLASRKNKRANIALRVNPNVETSSHNYISTGTNDKKFGIEYSQALALYLQAHNLSHINICGIATHIGSQITTLEPFLKATQQLLDLVTQLKQHGIDLEYIDIGGGLGITYQDEVVPSPQSYVEALVNMLADTELALHIEPGRSIVGNAGLLLTRVEYLKKIGQNNFAIVDAAMNDLLRPALYQSYHDIVPVHLHDEGQAEYAIVGPICESGDFLGTNRTLNLRPNDLLAVKDAGAYGFSLSSNYNSRPKVCELLVSGNNVTLINRRQTLEQLLENEIFAHEYATSS